MKLNVSKEVTVNDGDWVTYTHSHADEGGTVVHVMEHEVVLQVTVRHDRLRTIQKLDHKELGHGPEGPF